MTYLSSNGPIQIARRPRPLIHRRAPRGPTREDRGAWSVAGGKAIKVAVEATPGVVQAGLEALIASVGDLELVDRPKRRGGGARPVTRVDVLVTSPARLEGVRFPQTARVLVVATRVTDAELFDLLRAGIAGLLLHRSAAELLVPAIRGAAAGGCLVDPLLTSRLVAMTARGARTGAPDELSVQEQRVLGLVARGLTNREIATELGLSPHTVKSHVRSAMRKLGAADRHHAVELARGRDSLP